jgi:hypothetical protein
MLVFVCLTGYFYGYPNNTSRTVCYHAKLCLAYNAFGHPSMYASFAPVYGSRSSPPVFANTMVASSVSTFPMFLLLLLTPLGFSLNARSSARQNASYQGNRDIGSAHLPSQSKVRFMYHDMPRLADLFSVFSQQFHLYRNDTQSSSRY